MKKNIKKMITIAITFTFLLTAVNLSQANAVNKTILKDEKIETEKFTFYRYGPDGSVTPIEIEVDTKNIDNIGEFLADKCEELFQKDTEIQNFVKSKINNFMENRTQFNLSFDFGYLHVKSKGKGFHYNTVLLGKIMLRYFLFRLGLPRPQSILAKQLIFCRYPTDNTSQTTITPIIRSIFRPNATTQIYGNHSLLLISFVGFTSWLCRFSRTPFDIIPKTLNGIAKFAFWKEI